MEWKGKVAEVTPYIAQASNRSANITHTYISAWSSGLTLSIFVKVQGFTSEAAPELVNLLEWLSQFFDKDAYSSDAPNDGQRSYMFQKPINESIIETAVIAELDSNSENCQRIIVGTHKAQRMAYVEIDEPIYKFKC